MPKLPTAPKQSYDMQTLVQYFDMVDQMDPKGSKLAQ